MSLLNETKLDLPTGALLRDIADDLYANGFVHLRRAIPPAILKELQDELVGSLSAAAEDSKAKIFFDAQGEVLSASGLDRYSDYIFDLLRIPTLLEFVGGLLSTGVIPLVAEYFAKPSQGSAATPPHQNQEFHKDHFNDLLAIGLWCPLTEVTLHDSPLEYGYPATPPGRLLPHKPSDSPVFERQLSEGFPRGYTPVPASPGDVIIHHAYSVHRSAEKLRPGPRRAFVMNYRSSPYR